MPVNTLYQEFLCTLAYTHHQPDFLRLHIEEAIAIKQLHKTNPQPPTGDAGYGLSSLIFFHSSLDSFPFTCTSSLSWHSPARSTLLFSSPVLPHYPNIYSHSSHYPWSYTCTTSALSLAQFFLTILAQFLPILLSTNPIHAVAINEGPIPISVQTYFSFPGYWLKMVLNTETS